MKSKLVLVVGMVFGLIQCNPSYAVDNIKQDKPRLEQACVDYKVFNEYTDKMLNVVYICNTYFGLSIDECNKQFIENNPTPKLNQTVEDTVKDFNLFIQSKGNIRTCELPKQ